MIYESLFVLLLVFLAVSINEKGKVGRLLDIYSG